MNLESKDEKYLTQLHVEQWQHNELNVNVSLLMWKK